MAEMGFRDSGFRDLESSAHDRILSVISSYNVIPLLMIVQVNNYL